MRELRDDRGRAMRLKPDETLVDACNRFNKKFPDAKTVTLYATADSTACTCLSPITGPGNCVVHADRPGVAAYAD